MASRKSLGSEDDYWEASSAKNFTKHMNMFDENVTSDAKQLLQQLDFKGVTDDDDIDVISWEGTPVNTNTKIDVANSSARFRATPAPTNTTGPRPNSAGLSTVPIKPTSDRPSNFTSTTGDHALRTYSPNELSISDVVSSRTHPVSQTEVAKLETEINSLKRQLHASQRDRFAQISPEVTVRRMIMGEPVSLEMYRGREEKLQLLDEAISLHDGNAIIMIVLFLKKTVKYSIFQSELLRRPVAVEHYLDYLRQHYEFETLIDMLSFLGRTEEAAMIKYRQAVSVSQPEIKIRSLQTCHSTHFKMEPSLASESGYIQEQVSMLERQLPVDKSDEQEQQKGAVMFTQHPRKASIVDKPVITTLFYLCFYHYKLPENILASPIGVKKSHKLTDKQFVWIAMAARAQLKQWQDIEALFQTKGWLGGTKMKAVVPFDRTAQLLHKLRAPSAVIEKYCNMIDDTRHRMEVARKLNCYGSIIKSYVDLRDRQGLQSFQHTLKSNSQEWFYASDMLRNSSIKWKN